MTAIDVLIVGGGLQGLVLLRELLAARYSCVLITKGPIASGQTLHSHGLLNSGAGLLTGSLEEELHTATLPYLRLLGVPTYGEDRSYLLLRDEAVEELAPAWETQRYHPQRIGSSELPPGFESSGAVYRVRGSNVDKHGLVEALCAGLEPSIIHGEVIDATSGVWVLETTSGETLALEPRSVVAAAGCGTKRLIRDLLGVEGAPVDKIGYKKVHMLCLRGPAELLPQVGTVLSTDLIIVGHQARHASMGRLVTWYVTPSERSPARYDEAPDNAAAEVEPDVVRSAVEALTRLFRPLAHLDEHIAATVFAGYKQEFDGQPTRRVCEVIHDERNVLMVLPSVLANAVPNARDAITTIRQRLGAPGPETFIGRGEGVTFGELNEDVDQVRWSSWPKFADIHGVTIS